VARFTPHGRLDRTFEGTGSRTILLQCQDIVHGMAIDGSGRVVIVGGTYDCTENGDFKPAIVRLTARGTFDRSFSGDGRIVWKAFGQANGVAIQHLETDRIVVGGEGPFVAARYLSS